MRKNKAGHRWKNNVIFKVFIDTASGAQMWRLRSRAETSGPHLLDELNVPVTIKLGTSDTYVGTVTIKRVKARFFDPEP